MMRSIRRSISNKLMVIVLATTLTALLTFAVTMLIVDIRAYQTSWVNDLAAQADLLGQVSVPALEFNDPKAARENLQQLKSRPEILAAAIYTAGGKLFATYSRNASPAPSFPAVPSVSGYHTSGDRIVIFRQVRFHGEAAGSVYLSARYDVFTRVGDYLIILGTIMLGSFMVAALIAVWLQRAITRPILSVTETARQVVAKRDFSLKVQKSTEDEIGILVDAFNDMLNELGQRARSLETSNTALLHEAGERRAAEEALQRLNATLAERIAARTAELEHAHEQLRQSQKMEAIGQLTGGIAHDFNNLLAAMSGNVELMQMRLAQDKGADLTRYLDSTMSSIDRAAALTHRLLAFSRRQTLDPKSTNINRLVESMSDLLQSTVGPGIRVETALADDLWNTLCDQHQLENALLNLAINSRDAMREGGTLKVETRNVLAKDIPEISGVEPPLDECVMICITDTGVGMSAETLARAFDPFFTTKPLGQGTGLGLSMVYGFVSQSGGHVRISSEPRKGTTVCIYMPRHLGTQKVSSGNPRPAVTLTAPRNATILLVDDEGEIRAVAKEHLRELGYLVMEAADGPQAMEILRYPHRIDLLVTDIGLPNGMNGRQLANAARETRPDLRILLITGYADVTATGNPQSMRGIHVMTKPFKMDAFALRIRQLIEHGAEND